MRKFLCAVIAFSMITAQCAVYAETDLHTDNMAADNDTELTAVPIDSIVGEDKLTDDETDKIKAAIADALETAEPPEDITEAPSVRIEIPNDIQITMFDESGQLDFNHMTARAKAVFGIAENYLSDNPEYFYFEGINASYNPSAGNMTLINISYKHDKAEIETIQSELDDVTDDILTQMENDGIDLGAIKNGEDEAKTQAQFDAALWLHDYLVKTVTYDHRAYSQDEAEKNMVERTVDAALLDDCLTVCEGYSEAYKYILEKIGMECVNVYSDIEGHEWSAVKIGDAWYYVDVTQDDSDEMSEVPHNFFLVTADELGANTDHNDPNSDKYGTHHGGYITEIDERGMTFGDVYKGRPWHGTWQNVIDENGTPVTDESTGEPLLKWQTGNINTAVIFDGNDRYYGGFDDSDKSNIHSAIYKCGADLENSAEFYALDDGIWYTDNAVGGPRSYISGYNGGIGKNNGKLYFNSPWKIYSISIQPSAEQPVSPEVVFTYEPQEGEYVNCMFGTEVAASVIFYKSADIVMEGSSIKFKNEKLNTEIIDPCTVSFYDAKGSDGTENEENAVLVNSVIVPRGFKIEDIPSYTKYGYVITGWKTGISEETNWDFDNVVNNDMNLYAVSEAANWQMQPQLKVSDDCLIGTLNASIADFDATYSEAPAYMLAIYDNNTLVAIKTSTAGEFSIAPEENIPYTETTKIKVYAWSGENEPYLGGASVRIQRPSGETGGESETGGTEGEGENEGSTGGETGSGEGEIDGGGTE